MPKISIDLSNVDEPSGKMIDYVQDICRVLNIDEPEYTFKAYSDFIEEYKDEYWYEVNRYNEED